MNYLFHTITIGFIIYELMWLINPQAHVNGSKEFSEEVKKHKKLKWEDFSDDYKSMLKTKGFKSLVLVSWMFIGLLSFNWIPFLGLILFNLIIIAPLAKLTKYSVLYTILHWINSLVGFSVAIFILINSFHLKINLYELVLKSI